MASTPNRNDGLDSSKAQIARLTASGVLGFYTHFEITEIFAYQDGDRSPFNVFSILVAEEREPTATREPIYLGGRIKLRSLKDWTFGVQRTVRPIADVKQAVDDYCATGQWRPSGEQLRVGTLVPMPTQFVPPDSTAVAPWNNVLKNNFWAGSHVIEWVDPQKPALAPLFDAPPTLQELSDAVQKAAPIRLASLSDRLGNVVVQLPVTIVMPQFAIARDTGDAIVTIRWHPSSTPRSVRISSDMQFDNVVTGYVCAIAGAGDQSLPMGAGQGLQRSVLWDETHRIILAATGSTVFANTIAWNMNVLDPEPRTFKIAAGLGNPQEIRVGLIHTTEHSVSAPAPDRGESWTIRRMYRDEAARLAASRRFVQYKPVSGMEEMEHERALFDVRALLNQYGRYGACLWDPYLSAKDVLLTLFYCTHTGANLRALTAGYERPLGVRVKPTLASIFRLLGHWARRHPPWRPPPEPTFAEEQRAVFDASDSNYRGLRLEYRMKTGQSGWQFHDRFLIFPRVDDGALAWSLGTSVNSLGRQHHILQQVDDGQLVLDAFEDLWDQLDQPDHRIWKKP